MTFVECPRIALLHPYVGMAESESARRIVVAADRLGIAATECGSLSEVASCRPDMILALSHQNPKTLDIPTFGVLTAPYFWYGQTPRFIRNILSYDGYLTLSPASGKWLANLCLHYGKSAPIRFYGNTCPAQERSATLDDPHLVYIGTNWDGPRFGELFATLSRHSFMRIYGPPERWPHIKDSARCGSLAFDGESVLEAYRRAGVGLCLHLPDFIRSEMPSNRIFEITASGALAICDRNAFVQKHFGETVLYVDLDAPAADVVGQISAHMDWIAVNRSRAREMALAAQEIFNRIFSLERRLPSVMALLRSRTPPPRHDDEIDVLLPLDGRPPEEYDGFLKALKAQTHAKTTLRLVAPRGASDTMHALFDQWSKSLPTRTCAAEAATVGEALAVALKRPFGPYFCIGSPLVRWRPAHLANLLDAAKGADAVLAVAMTVESSGAPLAERYADDYQLDRLETHRLGSPFPFTASDIFEIGGNGPATWLARTQGFDFGATTLTGEPTLDDWLTQLRVLCGGSAVFCWEPTVERFLEPSRDIHEKRLMLARAQLKPRLQADGFPTRLTETARSDLLWVADETDPFEIGGEIRSPSSAGFSPAGS